MNSPTPYSHGESNDVKFAAALQAVRDLFSDMSVTREQTRFNLNALQSEIEIMQSALDSDDANERE